MIGVFISAAYTFLRGVLTRAGATITTRAGVYIKWR